MPGSSLLVELAHFVHRRFLWFLIGGYLIAAFFPALGLEIRNVHFGKLALFQQKVTLSLPVVMLALLLFNAGLGVEPPRLYQCVRHPLTLLSGLTANLLIPLGFIWCIAQLLRLWHNPDEVQNILVGLALVAAMPIAGSSTAWTQNANGDMTLSLALVLFSTFLSPLTTPIMFDLVEQMATGRYALALEDLETAGSGMMFWVIFPSVLGIVGRWLLGEDRFHAVKPFLKLVNSVNLLLLNYSNASVSLPQAIADRDWDFLVIILGIVLGLCLAAFGSGWLIARLLKVERSQQVSIMFGLGMNNNGTGLVLASLALAEFPRVMLPIIFYNLIQHLIAACVDQALSRKSPLEVKLELPEVVSA
jgi:bile acid:Na+ symporter, BASS family